MTFFKTRGFRICLVFALVLAVIGSEALSLANEEPLVQKIAPVGADAAARRVIALLADQQYAPIEQSLDPSLKTPQLRGKLVATAKLLQKGSIVSVDMVGAQQNVGTLRPPIVLSYEIRFARGVAASTIAFRRDGDRFVIVGLHVYPLDQPLEYANRFALLGKSTAAYLWLFASVGVMLFVLTTLVVCMWEQRVRWRWLWAVICCTGVAQFTMDWATGENQSQLVFLRIPAAAIWLPSYYAHWYVMFTVPLGAIAFWLLRGRLVASKQNGVEAASDTGLATS